MTATEELMSEHTQKVVVIGHINPDTDSICSAIAYADLKRKTSGLDCEPRRAGKLNQETAYVLERFGVPVPRMCTDVNPKVRNVEYRRVAGISRHTSMRRAWTIMRDQQIDTLAVVSEDRDLEGLISVKDIAIANMDVMDNRILAKSRTSYRNILDTMDGTMLVGDPEGVCDQRARVYIGAGSPDVLESVLEPGDIVILSNRYESQLCAIEMGVSLIIVCGDAKVGKTIIKLAQEHGVAVMSVPCDTYAAGKLISQCAPISYFMNAGELMKFTLITPVDEAIDLMAKVRHRYFPILDEQGKYCGMLSRRNILSLRKRQVILVDHNEATQAVEGVEQSDILEIIDHHRLGSLETPAPLYFRNQPVGSTATIVTQMYEEQGIEIPLPIAGLLLSAILSDTLKFSSPTCTPLDRYQAQRLAALVGLDIDAYAAEMFEHGERLEGKTAEDVFMQDFKVFMCGDVRFGVAQGNYVTASNLLKAKDLLEAYLPEALVRQNIEDVYVVLTDIQRSESVIIRSGAQAGRVLESAFGIPPIADGSTLLPGVVSRKKQFIPKLMAAYQLL